jgi:hypothetical protein
MKKTKMPSTAQDMYARHRREIGSLLASIGKKLAAHGNAAAQRPTDWGFVGDLGHVEGLLRKIDRFFG